MALKVGRVDTWVASLEDKPGNLAAKLNALAKAGVNLEFVLARRAPDQPGTGVVFVTPIKGAAGCRAARQEGFRKTKSLHAVRIEGPDKEITFTPEGKRAILAKLVEAEGFEKFCDLRFRG
ncbi:MAG: hypothetical protein KA118_09785, partial [Verrucomicrobia bacterium]|nr:hypothetical protein [Verrucomicrobiota bacterium]